MTTRRQFLKAGASAAAALALDGGQSGAQEPLRTVRIGVVGVGARGTGDLATLLQIPDVEVPAVCDIVEASAKQAQEMVEKATGRRPQAYTKDERDFENLCARDDLDAVVTATPWRWHTPVMLAAMRAGKYGGTEMPACLTVQECRELVKTSEETGRPCMMLENVCYFENVLAILRMVREGVFGDMLHCEAGYQHDCRFLTFTDDGRLTWRGEHLAARNGNWYPTHPLGPIAWWMNINRGDRFVSLSSISTKARGIRAYTAAKFGPAHPLARRDYAQGDINTTLLRTAGGGTVTLYFDIVSPRPYDLIFRAQGTKGIYLGTLDRLYLEGLSPSGEQWEPFAPYQERYAHPLWKALEVEAKRNGGHGGCDYITLYEFVKAVRSRTQTPQDVYDAATWSAVVPLSMESVARNGAPVAFPDFTGGRWKTNPPIPIRVA
jgi:predicted dehydrogenase